MRKLLRTRRGGLLAVTLAYAFAVQALMASVGLGMSAFAAPGEASFVICSHAAAQAPGGKDQNSGSAPHCPFCFVAAHGPGSLSLADDVPAFSAYAGVFVAVELDHSGQAGFVAQYRSIAGEPRAPPAVSV